MVFFKTISPDRHDVNARLNVIFIDIDIQVDV
uniref:Uncharacterized protein n=1 Tax=Arundo donax TaxID=35708 RepID=A0A0A8Z0N8_ARUDO